MICNGFRKRKRQEQVLRDPDSVVMREVSGLIARRKHAEGLTRINHELVVGRREGVREGRLLALAADSEFKRGKFLRAAEIYQRALPRLDTHHRHWLRPYIGVIRSELRAGNLDRAEEVGRQAVVIAKDKQAAFEHVIRQAEADLNKHGKVVVPPAPLRVSVVSTRIAYLFMQEGELVAANYFFGRALEVNERGGCRARQGMARIALAHGDAESAWTWAKDSIERGNYAAKTISAWPLLLAARRRLGGWRIAQHLIDGLKRAPAGVRARSVLVLVGEMRKHDMRQWQEVALSWLEAEGRQFPIIEAEIKKMILASWKAMPGHAAEKRQAAQRLLNTPGLSRNEWLSAAKEMVRASLWEGREVDLDAMVVAARKIHGDTFAFPARHGLALSCMLAKRHDDARRLLATNIHHPECPVHRRAKSLWALARMERALGNMRDAAEGYRDYWINEAYPARFRLQAQLLWVEAMAKDGQSGALMAAREEIRRILDGVANPEILMDFARQMSVITPELYSWAGSIFDRAADLARHEFAVAEHPSVALDVLFRLTRRQVMDFGRYEDAVRFWEDLDARKRTWLWTDARIYWEYLGLLITAYGRSGASDTTDRLAREWMSDPATTEEGRLYIGMAYGRWLLASNRVVDAMTQFDRATLSMPAHEQSAYAWYWLALEAHREEDRAFRDVCIQNVRRALGAAPGQLEAWNLDAKGLLLLDDLKIERVDLQAVNYPREFLVAMAKEVASDLERLP